MTLGYDIEIVRQKCRELCAAASAIFAHDPPDWLRHRLTTIMGEAHALDYTLGETDGRITPGGAGESGPAFAKATAGKPGRAM